MSFTFLPFSVFRCIYEGISPITELTGSQSIYPESLQKILINTLLKDDKSFCFSITLSDQKQQLCLHPSFTYADSSIGSIIFVSEEFYNQYLFNAPINQFLLHLIYNIPKTKQITLKRIEGNFPKDDSLNDLLTIYLEQCLIVNLGQQFTVGELKFEIHEIKSIEPIPKKNVEERLEEMDLSIRYNENITETKAVYNECSNRVINYNWSHHIRKSLSNLPNSSPNSSETNPITIGFVGQLEVEIDFVISEPIPAPVPVTVEPEVIPLPEPVSVSPESEAIPVLSKEELRRKRLQHLTNL